MKTNTYDHLENLAASKGVVCERRGRKIELTTPCGGTTAECETVGEALDTMRNDSTFSDLPIQIRPQAPVKPVQMIPLAPATTFTELSEKISFHTAVAVMTKEESLRVIDQHLEGLLRVNSEPSLALYKIGFQARKQLVAQPASEFCYRRLAVWLGAVQIGWI